jgi:CDP-glucose 4,6-dehydratase
MEFRKRTLENLVNMKDQFINTYSGKKVFLTGHTGFKGAWLVKILHLLGAEVKGYALAPQTEYDLYNLINGDKLCDSTIADLRDRNKLLNEIRDFKPEYVFHLAAQPLVRLSYSIPSETFEVNAIGTANLLDGIRTLDQKCNVVLITTDKVYHNNEWAYPYRETDRLGGYDPYSASKACAELVIDSYKNSFFNFTDYNSHKKLISVARAGNVIGGGDWSENRLLPDIAKSLIKGNKVLVRNPKSIRPWQHVLEPLFGYLLLGLKMSNESKQLHGAYNFGPYNEDVLSVDQMVKLAIQYWGNGDFENVEQQNQLHEAGILKLDISKAESELGWKPKMDAQKAVELTIEWYRAFNIEKLTISKFTEVQISNYLNLL